MDGLERNCHMAMYKIADNFGDNGWIWLYFRHNVGTYKGHFWCELQLPTTLIEKVNMSFVCF